MHVTTVSLIGQFTQANITSVKTDAFGPEQLKKDIRSLIAVLLSGTADQRLLALKKVNTDIISWHDANPKAEGLAPEFQRELQKVLTALMQAKKVQVDNNSAASVSEFLKLLPKEESVYVLSLYIQSYTRPRVDNEIHYSVQEFQENKVGDCSDVALYADLMFGQHGISSNVYELWFDYLGGGHAVAYYSFSEGTSDRRGYIDNTGVYADDRGLSPKMFIHSMLPQTCYYRKIEPLLWLQNRHEKHNAFYKNDSLLNVFIAAKGRAQAVCNGTVALDVLFDNPADEVLYFKDDAGTIIKKLDISKEKKEALEYFYYTSTNRIK